MLQMLPILKLTYEYACNLNQHKSDVRLPGLYIEFHDPISTENGFLCQVRNLTKELKIAFELALLKYHFSTKQYQI